MLLFLRVLHDDQHVSFIFSLFVQLVCFTHRSHIMWVVETVNEQLNKGVVASLMNKPSPDQKWVVFVALRSFSLALMSLRMGFLSWNPRAKLLN